MYFILRTKVAKKHYEFKSKSNYCKMYKDECKNETIPLSIKKYLDDNRLSEEDYKSELLAIRDFIVFDI